MKTKKTLRFQKDAAMVSVLMHVLILIEACHCAYNMKEKSIPLGNNAKGRVIKVRTLRFKKFDNKSPNIADPNSIASSIERIENATPTDCGKACQDATKCCAFLYFRQTSKPYCHLLDTAISLKSMVSANHIDYYEVKV